MRRCLAGLAAALFPVLPGCGPEPEGPRVAPARPSPPTVADVGWNEFYGPRRGPLRFEVTRLRVGTEGWSAVVAVANRTPIAWRVDPAFGLMLFADGDLDALTAAAQRGELPPPRRARRLDPPPPAALEAGATWRASISAPGRLPAGAYVRVVFGRFEAVGTPPAEMQSPVVWITDHVHRLPGD